ncbi:ABC transporter substrate-binding protein [Paenibacillus paeoniae]|uniref:ABC transporter substrate-binding protein n=1 Tax=Paenibacillus paeoniae TaxID=2292705 RepID=A0A371PL56_9BACL|nr:ABC transporter substrate-binding protein [Paenibacillus paeoniae]REK76705.1 ABC transporter substrate-binding protein [Paenibacillus paeoniae]
MFKKGSIFKFAATSLLLMSVVIAGCTNSANPKGNETAPSSTPAAGTENQPAKGSTITIAYSQGAGQTMDPHEAADLTSASYALALYDQLVTSATEEKDGKTVGRTDKVVPSLAKEWKVSDDGLTYTFTLEEKAKFQSGNPVNADAVVFSLKRLQSKGEGGSLYALSNIDSFTKVDDTTVEIKLSAPNPLLLKYLATFTFSIVDPSVVEGQADDYLTQHSGGSGPFSLEKWDPATEAVFVANKSYWKGAPQADKVIVKYIKEASNRELLLENGDVDVALDIPTKDVEKLRANKDLTISSESTNRIVYLGMNSNIKPFDNLKVREAINYMIPQEQLIHNVAYGQASPMTSSISSKSSAHTSEGNSFKFDPEKAKQLLKEAGYENGLSFDLVVSSATQDYEDIAVLLKSELEKIGVKLEIQKTAPAQYREIINKKEAAAFLGKYTSLVNDPSYHYGFLLATTGASNYAAYSNKDVDALLDSAKSITDEAKRVEIFQEVQKKITADAPWGYLYESNLIAGLRNEVKGYVFYPDEIIRFVTLSK